MVITDKKADINKGSWDMNSLLKRDEIFFWLRRKFNLKIVKRIF
jgi:hypothetical protein